MWKDTGLFFYFFGELADILKGTFSSCIIRAPECGGCACVNVNVCVHARRDEGRAGGEGVGSCVSIQTGGVMAAGEAGLTCNILNGVISKSRTQL